MLLQALSKSLRQNKLLSPQKEAKYTLSLYFFPLQMVILTFPREPVSKRTENTMQKRNYVDLVGYETQFCWKDFLFKVYCLLSSDKKWRYNYDPLHLTDAAILPCVQQIMSKIIQKNYKALSIQGKKSVILNSYATCWQAVGIWFLSRSQITTNHHWKHSAVWLSPKLKCIQKIYSKEFYIEISRALPSSFPYSSPTSWA